MQLTRQDFEEFLDGYIAGICDDVEIDDVRDFSQENLMQWLHWMQTEIIGRTRFTIIWCSECQKFHGVFTIGEDIDIENDDDDDEWDEVF